MPIFAIIRICCTWLLVWVIADEINMIWVPPLRSSILKRDISLDGKISRWKLARAPWWQNMCLSMVVLCAFICWMVFICVCPPIFVGGCECGAGKIIKTSSFMLMSPDLPRRVTLRTLTDNTRRILEFHCNPDPGGSQKQTGIAIRCTLEQFRTVCADFALVWNVMLKYSKAHVLCMKRQPQHHTAYVTRVSNVIKTLNKIREHKKILSDIARITRIT